MPPCFNCEVACPEDVIRFKFFRRPMPQSAARSEEAPGAGERAAGVVVLPIVRASTGLAKDYNAGVVRPRITGRAGFLARCIRCGECMKVCPTMIHPALLNLATGEYSVLCSRSVPRKSEAYRGRELAKPKGRRGNREKGLPGKNRHCLRPGRCLPGDGHSLYRLQDSARHR
jgi:ferredoxin